MLAGMPATIIVAILFALAVYFTVRLLRPRRRSSPYGLQMTPAEVEDEKRIRSDEMRTLEEMLRRAPFVHANKVDLMMARMRDQSAPFARLRSEPRFEDDRLLTVPEKKALGLNTRMKYSAQFIECFDPAFFDRIEPKAELRSMHVNAFHRAHRLKQLAEFRRTGVVKFVRVDCVGDADDCEAARKLRKRFALDQAPDLPLAACDVDECRCGYKPVLR
jgi:hypothetical protein